METRNFASLVIVNPGGSYSDIDLRTVRELSLTCGWQHFRAICFGAAQTGLFKWGPSILGFSDCTLASCISLLFHVCEKIRSACQPRCLIGCLQSSWSALGIPCCLYGLSTRGPGPEILVQNTSLSVQSPFFLLEFGPSLYNPFFCSMRSTTGNSTQGEDVISFCTKTKTSHLISPYSRMKFGQYYRSIVGCHLRPLIRMKGILEDNS